LWAADDEASGRVDKNFDLVVPPFAEAGLDDVLDHFAADFVLAHVRAVLC
jgi:hypothetical protein